MQLAIHQTHDKCPIQITKLPGMLQIVLYYKYAGQGTIPVAVGDGLFCLNIQDGDPSGKNV